MARISVIIPTKNAGQEFEDTLISIQSQDVDDIELIVIDSGSTDGTVELAEQYADTIIEIPPDEFHHGQTRNQAADQAEGDIIVFTVQDAVPIDDEWLSQLTSPINDGNADVCYGNQIAYPDAKPSDKFFYKYFYPDTSITLTKSDASKKGEFYMDNIFLSDANSAVSRHVWNQFQFLDSVPMSEDKDFAYRVASAGYEIHYCPESKVYHSHDYTLRSLFTRRYKDGKAFSEIAATDSDDFVFSGVRYVWNEYAYLINSGAAYWIPYALLYDFVYFISFTLGKNYEYLPTSVND
ncbi:glycosyltransferase family 2 protein [Haloferax sp. ATB1]|uniref:glycosyltransferase n=2 Tax=Haloferax sp. ATB1 TaxID=1508454 RepID=UPI0005B21833|nr:glycosyltransferase [Haloferax sp. ATB1]